MKIKNPEHYTKDFLLKLEILCSINFDFLLNFYFSTLLKDFLLCKVRSCKDFTKTRFTFQISCVVLLDNHITSFVGFMLQYIPEITLFIT